MLSTGFRSHSTARCWLAISALLILAFVLVYTYAAAVEPGNERFQRTWDRTDLAVRDGVVSRTWMWGPQANYGVMQEPYGEAPGGTRDVQYFDKARMEDNSYRASDAPWDVTNGLLVVELITGQMQVGDATFEQRAPAAVNVAGDFDDPTGPTYATFGTVLDASPLPIGSPSAPFVIAQSINQDGTVTEDLHWANYGIGTAYLDEVTNHSIAQPFWDFMNSSGTVYEDDQFVDDLLFENPYFATGRPITEAYWANVKVGGVYRDVLMQCFERRCLTYTPGNPEGFVVEAGNVGQHYFTWRYPDDGGATPTATPTATAEPTATEDPSPTPALNYAYADQWGEMFDSETLLTGPTGVAVSAAGRVYIANAATNQIMMFTDDGYYLGSWGSHGAADGLFDSPQGVAVDPDGNVYVADTNNHRIQKFDADGNYLTKWGTRGAEAGKFEAPQGIAIMDSGLVLVADTGNDRVQVFKTDGEMFGGWGSFGAGDGEFNLPVDIAIDQENAYIYVVDAFNHRIQKFGGFGTFMTKWGLKGTNDGEFDTPQGIAVDSSGNVYIADTKNSRVQKFTDDGTFIAKWGSMGIDRGEFTGPIGVALDGDDIVYVVELDGGQIQKFDGNGAYLDRWYDGWRGTLTAASVGLALDAGGHTYVTDADHACIQKFDAAGDWVLDFGAPCFGEGELNGPVDAVASPDGYLYVVDAYIGKIIKYTQDGALILEWGKDGTGNGAFDEPSGLALDADGNVYVADRNNNRIQKFSADGLYITQWGTPGNGNGEFNHPFDIAIHGERVYVVDQDNYRVQEFDRDGNYIDQWGSFGSGEGQFERPAGIAVDGDGYVYITDIGPDGMTTNPIARIQKFASDGDFLTQLGSLGSGDGQFNKPYRVEVDAAGNVYVLDTGNYRVQKFIPVP